MRAAALGLMALCAFAAPARAQAPEVAGFTIATTVETPLSPDAAFRRFVDVASWWNPAHTYSGDAKRLKLELHPGGCWCERLDGGFVEHMAVINVDRGKALRLRGGLGPLQTIAAEGVMSVTFEPAGQGARVSLTYIVPNPAAGPFAGPVRGVLEEQLQRFAASAP